MYVPFAQAPLDGGEVVVRSSLSPSSVAAGIRQAVRSIDKNLPVTDIAAPLPGACCRRNFWRGLVSGVAAHP